MTIADLVQIEANVLRPFEERMRQLPSHLCDMERVMYILIP